MVENCQLIFSALSDLFSNEKYFNVLQNLTGNEINICWYMK